MAKTAKIVASAVMIVCFVLEKAKIKETWNKMDKAVVARNNYLRMTAQDFGKNLKKRIALSLHEVNTLIHSKILHLLVFCNKSLCSLFLNLGWEDATLLVCGLRIT